MSLAERVLQGVNSRWIGRGFELIVMCGSVGPRVVWAFEDATNAADAMQAIERDFPPGQNYVIGIRENETKRIVNVRSHGLVDEVKPAG